MKVDETKVKSSDSLGCFEDDYSSVNDKMSFLVQFL